MDGISAIRGGAMSVAWQQARYYMYLSSARSAAANPARPETPVEPVAAVKSLPADVPVRMPVSLHEAQLPTETDLDNAAEALGRMRIQYPGEEASPLQYALQGKLAGLENELARTPLDSEDDAEEAGTLGVWESKSPAQIMEETECKTCAKRRYQDGSDDPGVSFKTPTEIGPDQAAAAVRGHEQEHVVREQAEAAREGRKVVSQSVSIHTDICPECGRVYISGGTTRTVTAADNDSGAGALRPEESGKDGALGPVA